MKNVIKTKFSIIILILGTIFTVTGLSNLIQDTQKEKV